MCGLLQNKWAVKFSSLGGGRSTDESGWKLRSCQDSSGASEDLQDALMSAQQQIDNLEKDALMLEYIAGEESLEVVCDLDVRYSNPHLEVRAHKCMHAGRCRVTQQRACAKQLQLL